jgi:hypothetical protein
MTSRLGIAVGGMLVLAAAAAIVTRRARSTPEVSTAPTGVVDSVVPREEALAKFRVGLTPTDSLVGGAESREALVRTFLKALEQRDTATVRRLVLSKQEFAFLFYPTNPQSLPPYDLSPSLYWFTLEGRSRQGLAKAWELRGGTTLRYLRTTCPDSASVEGENTIYGPCGVVHREDRKGVITERLFGPIIERRGRWKFVSYANRLD